MIAERGNCRAENLPPYGERRARAENVGAENLPPCYEERRTEKESVSTLRQSPFDWLRAGRDHKFPSTLLRVSRAGRVTF